MISNAIAKIFHAYWLQKPGFLTDEREVLRILYDYVITRNTWREDKTGRAEEALAHQHTFDRNYTLGVGQKLGPFWYPSMPELQNDTYNP